MIIVLGYDSSSVSNLGLAEVGDYLRQPGALLWLDVIAPTEAELIQLRQLFQFQRQHLDACRGEIRPPLAATPRYLFTPMTAADGQPWFVFMGKTYLVTIHADPLEAIAAQYGRYAQEVNLWSHGVDQLFLSLTEASVYPFAERLAALKADGRSLFERQEALLHLERQIGGQTAVLQQISGLQQEYLDANIAHYLGQTGQWLHGVSEEAAFHGRLLAQQIEARRHELLGRNLAATQQMAWIVAFLFALVLIMTIAFIAQLFL